MAEPAKQVIVQAEPAATNKGVPWVVLLGHDIGVDSEPPNFPGARATVVG